MIVYLARAIQAFVMYCVNGTSRSSLLIESTDSMIIKNEKHLKKRKSRNAAANCHPYFAQVKSMDDNCGQWVECMGVASGCGEQEVGVASGRGWNLWVWL